MSEQRESAQPCGCDPGMGHFCAYHDPDTLTQQGVWKNPKAPFTGLPRPVPSPDTFIDVAQPGNARVKVTAVGTGPIEMSVVPAQPRVKPILPGDAKTRKTVPVATGVLDYFPRALTAIAHVSYLGNEQHNPGQPLHWSRPKSSDHPDCLIRHFLQRGTLDEVDGMPHSAKMAWRALAILELELEGK